MDPLRKVFAVVLASAFLSTNVIVHGSSIDLTKEMRNSSTVAEISRAVPSPNTTSPRQDGGLGSQCDSKNCLLLCCAPGMAQLQKTCVKDNASPSTWPKTIKSEDTEDVGEDQSSQNVHLVIGDPCSIDWMTPSVSMDFNLLQNGSVYALDIDGGKVYDSEHYCLFRMPESEVYLAKVCRPWIVKVYWQIACLIFNAFVMLAIFIGYSVVPELRNLHGMVFRSYVAMYILTHLFVVGQQLTVGTRAFPGLFTFFVFGLHYTAGCCALWLNVMSYNIWRTFRSVRSFESNIKEHDKKKFIWYAIYAWVTPGVINISTMLIMCYVPYFRQFSLSKNLILWTCAILLTSVIICNGILHAFTALRIRRYQKDTAHLAQGVNKHHEMEKQWFNLHVKLFMITGAHTIMWVIWELWPIEINTTIMIILEVVQSILIFVIFIWKDNVKRSLRKQFNDTVCRLQSTFGTIHTTSTTRSHNVKS